MANAAWIPSNMKYHSMASFKPALSSPITNVDIAGTPDTKDNAELIVPNHDPLHKL